jgi:hypothetical protein
MVVNDATDGSEPPQLTNGSAFTALQQQIQLG